MSAHRITCAVHANGVCDCTPHPPMMECGHSANANTTIGNVLVPCCAICACDVPAAAQPDLSERTARCSYYGKQGPRRSGGRTCTSEVPSDTRSAFFAHHPEREHDEFYCGCWGWD